MAARVDELTAWKSRTVLAPRWWQDAKGLRIYAIASTAAVVVLGVLVARDFIEYVKLGKPYQSHWVHATLVVSDIQGREIWRKDFEDGPMSDTVTARYHVDLDGDSRVESLVPHITAKRDSKGGLLYCFSDKGKELWRIEPNRAVSDRQMKFSTLYVLRSYKVFPSPEKDGTQWTAATFAHHYAYPCVVVVVDGKGRIRGQYWHSGHLDGVHVLDLNNDGNYELVLCGTSVSSSRAVLVVFDPKKVDGAEVLAANHPNQLLGFGAGTEKATVLFERSRLNKLRDHYNYAYWIGPTTASADRSFQVTVSEALDRTQGYLIYTIRPDLSLESVVPSDSLRNTYLEHTLKNPSSKPFGESDLDELRRGYTVRWVNSAAAATRLPSR